MQSETGNFLSQQLQLASLLPPFLSRQRGDIRQEIACIGGGVEGGASRGAVEDVRNKPVSGGGRVGPATEAVAARLRRHRRDRPSAGAEAFAGGVIKGQEMDTS